MTSELDEAIEGQLEQEEADVAAEDRVDRRSGVGKNGTRLIHSIRVSQAPGHGPVRRRGRAGRRRPAMAQVPRGTRSGMSSGSQAKVSSAATAGRASEPPNGPKAAGRASGRRARPGAGPRRAGPPRSAGGRAAPDPGAGPGGRRAAGCRAARRARAGRPPRTGPPGRRAGSRTRCRSRRSCTRWRRSTRLMPAGEQHQDREDREDERPRCRRGGPRARSTGPGAVIGPPSGRPPVLARRERTGRAGAARGRAGWGPGARRVGVVGAVIGVAGTGASSSAAASSGVRRSPSASSASSAAASSSWSSSRRRRPCRPGRRPSPARADARARA